MSFEIETLQNKQSLLKRMIRHTLLLTLVFDGRHGYHWNIFCCLWISDYGRDELGLSTIDGSS